MSDENSLDIRIMDKDYTVVCPKDQQVQLIDSARFLNNRLTEIKRKGSIIGSERIAVMAALNLAHELLSSQKNTNSCADLDNRVLNLHNRIDSVLQDSEAS